jgi:hypothetical protein
VASLLPISDLNRLIIEIGFHMEIAVAMESNGMIADEAILNSRPK